MKKFCYSILITVALALLSNYATLSASALGEIESASSSTPVTEADFGSAGMGSVGNTTNYSIAPNTAYDNMNYQQTNTSAAGTPISDYPSALDQSSAASSSGGQVTSKNIPTGGGQFNLPVASTGTLATTMVNQQYTGKVQSGSYNFGFTGLVAPSLYAIKRGISLPQVSSGSIIMNDGFTPY